MAKLKWGNDYGGCVSVCRATSSDGHEWYIAKLDGNRFTVDRYTHDELLKDPIVRGAFDCVCKAKAACQAAEDKICSTQNAKEWPKYYGSNDYYRSSHRNRIAFFKAHSPERIDAIQANGISRRFSCPGIVFANPSISETDAISRLDESATTTALRCWLSKIGR